MKDEFFIVKGSVLPETFCKVIEVKTLLAARKVKDISEAVKQVGISRSVFYRYKDNVFLLSEMGKGRKVTLTIQVEHLPGVLSNLLEVMALNQASVLTINQGVPINECAFVTLTMDISQMTMDIKTLIQELETTEHVIQVTVLAME